MFHSNGEKDLPVVPDAPHILVVDDDDIVLRGVADTLKDRFEVTCTKSPKQALGIIRNSPCEILLTDLMMEEMHGLELIQNARNIRPSLVSIVMTGHASKETAIGALNEGAHDFLEKPFSPQTITQTVLKAWKGLRTRLLNNRLLAELKQTNQELLTEVEMRRLTEVTLQDERGFISAVLDNAGAIILVLNREGRILRCNKACEKITGYSPRELRGRFIRNFITTEGDAPEPTAARGEKEYVPLSEENRWITRDGGHKVISWSNTLLKNEGEPDHQVSIGIDITEKRHAEEEAKLHRRQLYQADKMVTLGILVSGVAHEINNPNNFIMMNGSILHEIWESITPILDKHYEEHGDFLLSRTSYSKMRGNIPKLFSGINNGAKRIKTIVENLKDYAREGGFDMGQNVDINNAIKTVVTLLANQIQKSTGAFTVTYCDNPPNIKGNLQRIEQVLINLLQNACQALADIKKGIDITAFHDEKNNQVIVRIKDEGTGIPEEHMDHIFDPFFTTKRDSKGTGLGLSISTGIVKEHGGKLEFTSKEGKGTTASLILPVSASAGR